MPTIEERALALVNTVMAERKRLPVWSGYIQRNDCSVSEALCRAIETLDAERAAHAQFRQKVSDEVEKLIATGKAFDLTRDTPVKTPEFYAHCKSVDGVRRFIIVKPDPLVEAVRDCGYATLDAIEPEFVADLRAALSKRGLKLVEVGDAD